MRARRTALIPIAATVAILAGCGSAAQHHTTSTTSTPQVASSAARTALVDFGQTFGRYLDGQLPATHVANLAAGMSAHLGIRIAADARTGTLQVSSVAVAPLGQTSTIVLRDRRHTIAVKVILRQISNHDRVVWVTTGDLDSIAQPPSPPLTQPKGSGGAQQAARTFLAGYLPWLYSRGVIPSRQRITASFADSLRHAKSLPQAPGAPNLHPTVAAIGMQRAGRRWIAEANIADAERSYQLNLTVTQTTGRWTVTQVRAPGGPS